LIEGRAELGQLVRLGCRLLFQVGVVQRAELAGGVQHRGGFGFVLRLDAVLSQLVEEHRSVNPPVKEVVALFGSHLSWSWSGRAHERFLGRFDF
jgi:hypothetical protein